MASLSVRIVTVVTFVALGAFAFSGVLLVSILAAKGNYLQVETSKSLAFLKEEIGKEVFAVTKKKAEVLVQGESRLAADFIANFNLPQLDELAKNLVLDPDVVFVEFTTADGKRLSSAGEAKVDSENMSIPIAGGSGKIGEMKISLSRSSSQKLLERFDLASTKSMKEVESAISGMLVSTALTMFLGMLVSLVVLSLVVAVVLNKLVLVPVNAFGVAIQNLSLGKMQSSDSTLEKIARRTDEIGQIAQSVNKLSAYFDEQARIAEQVAQGNLALSPTLASDFDRFGLAYRKMIEKFCSAVREMKESSDVVEQTGVEVGNEVGALSQVATCGAAAAEQNLSSVQDVTQQLKQTILALSRAATESEKVMRSSQAGQKQIDEILETMDAIVVSSRHVQGMVKTIDEIAFQTNLLALNAAVEAAHAGKHGKGFAVVAEEVRGLSARSAKAAREASQIVESAANVATQGVELVRDGFETFRSIAEQSATLASSLQKLSASSKEQVEQVGQVATGMEQVSMGAQGTTAAVDRLSQASKVLGGRSHGLREFLQNFRT